MHTRYRICLQVTLRLICSKIRINLFLPTSSFLYTKGFGKTSGVGTNLTHGSTAGDAHGAGMEAGGHSTRQTQPQQSPAGPGGEQQNHTHKEWLCLATGTETAGTELVGQSSQPGPFIISLPAQLVL